MVTVTLRDGTQTYQETYIFFVLADKDGFTIRDSKYPNQAAIEADILRMEGISIMETQYHVVLIQDPEQKVFSIRETIGVDQYHDFFQRLYQEAEARGLTQAGPIQMLYHDEAFNPKSSDVEAQMVVAQDGPDVSIKPPVYLRGGPAQRPL